MSSIGSWTDSAVSQLQWWFEGREWPCHQRGGAGGSFFVGAVLVVVFVVLVAGVVSLRLRFSSATSKVMTSTQPMASKSAKFRNEP